MTSKRKIIKKYSIFYICVSSLFVIFLYNKTKGLSQTNLGVFLKEELYVIKDKVCFF